MAGEEELVMRGTRLGIAGNSKAKQNVCWMLVMDWESSLCFGGCSDDARKVCVCV